MIPTQHSNSTLYLLMQLDINYQNYKKLYKKPTGKIPGNAMGDFPGCEFITFPNIHALGAITD